MTTVHHRYATVEGRQVFYREAGPPGAPAVVPLPAVWGRNDEIFGSDASITALGKRLGTLGHVVFQCLRPGSRQRLAARIPPAIPAAMTPGPCCVHASAARHSKRPGHTAAPWAPSAPWNTR